MMHVCDGRDLACLGCAAIARGHVLVRAAMTRDETLDDLQRARIWNALEDRLAEPALGPVRRWAFPIAITASIAAAAAIVLVAATRPAAPQTLSVASGATLISPIGPHTHAALVGPATVELVGTPGAATTVRLRRGTLLAEFDGGAGRSLRVLAPGLEVEVVGTLFAIEVRGAHACVSVAHGKVRVTTAAGTQLVTDRQATCAERREGTQPIAPAIEDALAKHARTLTAQADRAEPTTTIPAPASSHPRDPATSSLPTTATTSRPAIGSPTNTASSPPANPPAASSPAPHAKPTAHPVIETTTPPVARTAPAPTSPPPQISPPPTTSRPTATGPTPPTTSPPATDPTPPTTPQTTSRTTAPSPTSTPTTSRTTTPAIPPPTPPRPAASPVPTTADELYRAAEQALAARNPAAADHALDRLVTEHPGSPLVEQALYDRARLAHQKRAWGAARRHLDRLLALPSPRLAEPARYLACRIAVEAQDGEAASCLAEYRRSYPHSPHQRDVLGMLVQLEHATGGCVAAAPRIRELVRAYGASELASAWRARCPEAK